MRLGHFVSGVCNPKDTRILANIGDGIDSIWNRMDTGSLYYPIRYQLHRTYDLCIELHRERLDWDCNDTAKTIPTVQNNGGIAIAPMSLTPACEKGRERMKSQRLGGYAAIASVLALVPMPVIALQLGKRFGNLADPTKFTAVVTSAPVDYSLVNILHIVHFIIWQILFCALHERMQNKAHQLTRIALIAVSAGTAIMVAG